MSRREKRKKTRSMVLTFSFSLLDFRLLRCDGRLGGQHNRAEVTGVLGVVGIAAPDLLGNLLVVSLVHGHVETVDAFDAEVKPVAFTAKVVVFRPGGSPWCNRLQSPARGHR